MVTFATPFGATLGAFILFPLFGGLLLKPLKNWHSPFLKYALVVAALYIAATIIFAWGDADELRQSVSFAEIVRTRANWFLYLPGAVLAFAFMALRAKGKDA